MDKKTEILLSFFDNSGLGLEIGPQARGVAPKRDGFNVEIIDYIDAKNLKELHANNDALDKTMIEEVDYVSGGQPIGDVIPHESRFDYIIASHVIEHMPNFVQFLKDCQRLLKPAGRLVLAVPDMRFIFDAFRPLTSLGDVMEAYRAKPSSHSPGSILDYYAYVVNRNGKDIIWNPGDHGTLNLIHPISEARKQYDVAVASEAYIDTHAWMFTPSSFRLLISDLFEMGEIGLRETHFQTPVPPHTYPEFYISLSCEGKGHEQSRTSLMQQTIRECRDNY